MKYMLLTYLEEKVWLALSPEEQRAQMESCGPLIRKLVEQKKLLAGAPLHPTSTATTLRYRDGKRLLTDGPFAETREQLGGFFMIKAKDLDEAIDIAGRIPAGRWGTVEIRPVIEVEGLPPT